MARAGYAAKGAVYVLVGVLAFMAAFGLGGSISGPKEALESLKPKTFGEVLLGLVAVGLCCYSIWRFVQSFYDPDHKGREAKAIAVRVGYALFTSAILLILSGVGLVFSGIYRKRPPAEVIGAGAVGTYLAAIASPCCARTPDGSRSRVSRMCLSLGVR